MKKIVASIFFTFVLLSTNGYADINTDLHSFFKDLGFESNTTLPSSYQGQEAGYYTGGSLFARTSIRDVQLMQLDLPSSRSGCGGIDLYAGGFSFINKDQLIKLLKNIMNNATSYAFTLAMETATPQLTNVMKYLQNAANTINQMNINSCETAVGLLGSVWPRTQEVSRRVCEDIGSKRGVFSDYAEAKHGCSARGQLSSTLKKGEKADKSMIFDEGNVAWLACMQNDFLKTDTDLAELFMSLSGTIIVRKKDGDNSYDDPSKALDSDYRNRTEDDKINIFVPLASLATDQKLLRAILYGGTAKIYKCDDFKACLNPRLLNINIKETSSLVYQTKKILDTIAEKIQANEAATPQEIGLLQATTLPVYKMLNIQAAFYKDGNILDVSSYAEVIAIDILFQYLAESMSVVRTSSATLQYPEEIMRGFIAGIDKARTELRGIQKSAYSQIVTTSHLVQQTQMIEQMLTGQFSSNLANTLTWTKGVRS